MTAPPDEAELTDTKRDAITAAAAAIIDRVGHIEAHRVFPSLFPLSEVLAIADSLIELPLDDVLTAAGVVDLPTIDDFIPPPDMPPGSGHFVEGRKVWGRLAEWNVPHIGIDGKPVYAPRNTTGYRWFHTKRTKIQGPNGVERIKIGHLTFGCGHAGRELDHIAAAAHYENSRYRGAKVRMVDDQYGPVYAGVLCGGVEGQRLEEFEESDTSGDWRRIMGHLELIAALCVNIGGFPKVGLGLAASGEVMSLVAAGKPWRDIKSPDVGEYASAVVAALDRRDMDREERAQLVADLTGGVDDEWEILAATLIEDDEELAELVAAGVPSTMPPQLQQSYLVGKVAKRIRWRTPGDMTRCIIQAKAHGMGHKAEGACATLHKKANGYWPGDRRNL